MTSEKRYNEGEVISIDRMASQVEEILKRDDFKESDLNVHQKQFIRRGAKGALGQIGDGYSKEFIDLSEMIRNLREYVLMKSAIETEEEVI